MSMKDFQNIINLIDKSGDELKELEIFFNAEFINKHFYRRILVRNIYSVIESDLFVVRECLKMKVRIDNINLSQDEFFVLEEKDVLLNKNGTIKRTDKFFKFEHLMRFTINMSTKIFEVERPDFGDSRYESLMKMSKRRNEITHPKDHEKQFISKEEIPLLLSGLNWFMEYRKNTLENVAKWFDSKGPFFKM